jgi:serine/threonine-protein kinase
VVEQRPVDAGEISIVEPSAVDAGAPRAPVVVAQQTGGTAKLVHKGKLSLETEPWTKVYLGKRLLGETPLLEVPLPAGPHRLRLQNAEEGIDAVIEVDIVADGVTVKRLAL